MSETWCRKQSVSSSYDWVCEVMNPLLVTDECAVDGVDDERCPADYERDDNKNERHCDVSLLLVDLILAYRRTVSQMSSIRTDHPQHAASTYKHTQRCLQW